MKNFLYALLISFLLIQQAFCSVETAETLYAKAYGAIYKNNTKEAIRIFEKGQEYFPDCAFLYAGMADAYLREGNFDKALEFYIIAQRKKSALDIYKIDFYNAYLQKNMQDISNALNQLISATKISDNPSILRNINLIMNENYEQTTLITELYLNTANEDFKE